MERLSVNQVSMLLVSFLMGTTIILVPIMEAAYQDSWLALLASGLPGLLVLGWILWLYPRYPGMGLVQISLTVLGPILGSITGFAWVLFFFTLTVIVGRNIVDFFHVFFVQSPELAIIIPQMALTVYAVRLGKETIARFAELVLPGAVALFLLLVLLISPELDFRQFQPVLLEGPPPVIWGAILAFTFPVGITITLLPFFTAINSSRPRQHKLLLLAAYATGIFILSLRSVVSVGVMGPVETSVQLIPIYSAFRQIEIFDIIQRVDFLTLFIFAVTGFIKFFVCMYTTTAGLAALLRLPDYRILVIPLAILLAVEIKIGIGSVFDLIIFQSRAWPIWAIFFIIVFPALLTVAIAIKSRAKTPEQK